MGLIENDHAVPLEERVGPGLGQQDAVGHEFDPGLAAGVVMEADGVPHMIPLMAQFFPHPFGHGDGSNAAGLGAADEFIRIRIQFQTEFGQLGGFARAGVTGHDQDLVFQ